MPLPITGKGFARCGKTNDELRAWKKSSTCENLPGAAFNPASCETHVVRRAFFSYNFSFFCFDKVNNFFLSHGKSPTKILINFPKMFCAIFLQTSCTLLKYSRSFSKDFPPIFMNVEVWLVQKFQINFSIFTHFMRNFGSMSHNGKGLREVRVN